MIKRYRQEKIKFEANIQKSPLLGDHHPHCLLVIEGAHESYRISGLA
jgi:hypothetical protein